MAARLRVWSSGEVCWSYWCPAPPVVLPPPGGRQPGRIMSPRTATCIRRYLENCLCVYAQMVTLTFVRTPARPRASLRAFVKRLRRLHGRGIRVLPGHPWSVFWFREYQRRGVLHYHLYLCGFRFIGHQWIGLTWRAVVGSNANADVGTSVRAITERRAGVDYACAYARKAAQKSIPASEPADGHWWGVEGCRSVASVASWESPGGCTWADFVRPDLCSALRERASAYALASGSPRDVEAPRDCPPVRGASSRVAQDPMEDRLRVLDTLLEHLGEPKYMFGGDSMLYLRYDTITRQRIAALEASWLSACVPSATEGAEDL